MHLPPLTVRLLWACLASLVLTLTPPALQVALRLWPLDFAAAGAGLAWLGHFRPWQLVTHLVYNSLGGLIFIALTLLYFGAQLEDSWGTRRYGLFLIACAATATLAQLGVGSAALALGLTQEYSSAGASSVAYGILFVLAWLVPRQLVRLWLPPVEVRMRTLVIVMCVVAFVFGVQAEGLWAQSGFLGGMLGAWLHVRYWRGEPPFRRRKKPPAKRPPHLRVV
jgi:membrane associated rhomboid family serine protease